MNHVGAAADLREGALRRLGEERTNHFQQQSQATVLASEQRSGRVPLVDYDHDDVTIYPEAEESSCLISSICTREISFHGRTRGLLTCYPDTTLLMAKELMEAKETSRRLIAILHYDSILKFLREEISHMKSIHHHRKENLDETSNGH